MFVSRSCRINAGPKFDYKLPVDDNGSTVVRDFHVACPSLLYNNNLVASTISSLPGIIAGVHITDKRGKTFR